MNISGYLHLELKLFDLLLKWKFSKFYTKQLQLEQQLLGWIVWRLWQTIFFFTHKLKFDSVFSNTQIIIPAYCMRPHTVQWFSAWFCHKPMLYNLVLYNARSPLLCWATVRMPCNLKLDLNCLFWSVIGTNAAKAVNKVWPSLSCEIYINVSRWKLWFYSDDFLAL